MAAISYFVCARVNGYWAPGGDFVLYYDDNAPYFDGIVRIGEIDGDVQPITRLPEDSSVTIERAD